MNGVILVDKPQGYTSRDMVNKLNHIFDMKKIGHTGTLDPLATGILVMCLGRYTKMVDMLSSYEKEYIAKIKIGIKTDTLDITGNILKKDDKKPSKEDVLNVLSSLKGKITQEVPLYSAKKINGQKLYEYARKGKEIQRPKNEIEIYEMELLSYENDEITFKCLVSKGTYIRSIIELICDKLKILGTMSSLVRTKQGKFLLKDAYSIEDIIKGNYKLLKAQDLFSYPIYNLNEEEYKKAINGNKLSLNLNDKYVIFLYNHKEIAIYEKKDGLYQIKIMLS